MNMTCHICNGTGFTVLPDGVKPVCTTCKGTGQVGVTSTVSMGQAWEKLMNELEVVPVMFIHDELLCEVRPKVRNVTPPNRIIGQIEGHKVMADADLSDMEVRVIADALKKLEDKDG